MRNRTADEGNYHQSAITVLFLQVPRFSAPRVFSHNVSQFFSRLRVNKCRQVVDTARDGNSVGDGEEIHTSGRISMPNRTGGDGDNQEPVPPSASASGLRFGCLQQQGGG